LGIEQRENLASTLRTIGSRLLESAAEMDAIATRIQMVADDDGQSYREAALVISKARKALVMPRP
jgi:hypothetical protein